MKGAVGNAAFWGGVWALASVPVMGLLQILGLGSTFGLLPLAPRIVGTLAAMGFVAGGAVSAYLALAPRRRLGELSPPVLGVLGGLFGAAMVPTFGFLPALASVIGVPFPTAVLGATVIAAALGVATSVGAVKLAQSADQLVDPDNPGLLGADDQTLLGTPPWAE